MIGKTINELIEAELPLLLLETAPADFVEGPYFYYELGPKEYIAVDKDGVIVEYKPRKEFDMNSCKKGDKLLSVHGNIFTYVGLEGREPYPHIVSYPDGAFGSRNNQGFVFINRPNPADEDIVAFYKGN